MMRWDINENKLCGIFLLQILLCGGRSEMGKYVANSIQLPFQKELLMSGLDALEAVMMESQKEKENPNLCSTLIITDGTTTHQAMRKLMERPLHPQGLSIVELRLFGKKFHQMFTRAIEKSRKLRLSLWCLTVVVVSENAEFLEWLAKVILKGRLLIWNTRLIVLTSLQQDDLWRILAGHWTFSMMSTVFVNRLSGVTSVGGLDERWGLYTYLPYSDRGSSVTHLATWMPNGGIVKHKNLPVFVQKFESFHGATVNVTAQPFAPFWMEETVEGEDGKLKKTGSDYLLAQTVAQSLNFRIQIIPTKSWKEVIEKVRTRDSFFSPNFHCFLQSRLKENSFTIPYEFLSWTFIMVRPSLQPQWQSLYHPLASDVWILVLVTLLIIPLPLHLLSREGTTRCRSSFLAVVLGALLGQNLPSQLSKQSQYRFLLATWLFFCLVIGTAYRGNLTAFLMRVKEPPRPENARQLMDLDVTPVMPPYGKYWRSMLLSSNSPALQELGRRMEIVPNLDIGIEQAATGKFVLMEVQSYLKYIIAKSSKEGDGSSPFYIAKEATMQIMCGWPVPHDAPYKHVLDKKIRNVLQSGIHNMWSQSTVDVIHSKAQLEAKRRQNQTGIEPSPENASGMPVSLTLKHLQGALLLLVLGWSISSVVLVTELLTQRC